MSWLVNEVCPRRPAMQSSCWLALPGLAVQPTCGAGHLRQDRAKLVPTIGGKVRLRLGLTCHSAWQPGQAQIAAAGGADRRSARNAPRPRWHRVGTGRAAELASEAARAEGASPPRHRPWPAAGGFRSSAIEACGRPRRLSGAACGGSLIQQPTRSAVPSRLTLGRRCRSCTAAPRATW